MNNTPVFLRPINSTERKGLMTLEYEALRSANERGHKIGRITNNYIKRKGKSADTSTGKCVVCGMEFVVTTNPAPNDIEIGGEAVALNCNG